MRGAKQSKPLSTGQWVVLEVFLLANVALASAFVLLGVADGWLAAGRFSHRSDNSAAMNLKTATAVVATPTSTATPLPSATPSPISTLAATVALTASNTPTPVATWAVAPLSQTPTPGAVVIANIVGRRQSLPLSCESRSAADLAAYYGVAIDELEFFHRLPVSDNPDVGFSGDVNGTWGQVPPNPYGVHAAPVAELLRAYGLNASGERGLSWEFVRTELSAGRPLIAWVVGHVWRRSNRAEYLAADGSAVWVAPYEHTVIVIGYDENNVVVLDGDQTYSRPLEVFLSSWSVLGNMAVWVSP